MDDKFLKAVILVGMVGGLLVSVVTNWPRTIEKSIPIATPVPEIRIKPVGKVEEVPAPTSWVEKPVPFSTYADGWIDIGGGWQVSGLKCWKESAKSKDADPGYPYRFMYTVRNVKHLEAKSRGFLMRLYSARNKPSVTSLTWVEDMDGSASEIVLGGYAEQNAGHAFVRFEVQE